MENVIFKIWRQIKIIIKQQEVECFFFKKKYLSLTITYIKDVINFLYFILLCSLSTK